MLPLVENKLQFYIQQIFPSVSFRYMRLEFRFQWRKKNRFFPYLSFLLKCLSSAALCYSSIPILIKFTFWRSEHGDTDIMLHPIRVMKPKIVILTKLTIYNYDRWYTLTFLTISCSVLLYADMNMKLKLIRLHSSQLAQRDHYARLRNESS